MKAQTVTIIGMGRTGASIGRALKSASSNLTIVGHDRYRDVVEKAKDKLQAIDKVEWNLISAAAAADILVLALPLTELEDTLMVIGRELQPHTLVLDMGALKGQGLQWANKYLKTGHYVGVVPVLAASYLKDGRDEAESAAADLFQKSIFCLMPSATADPRAVETAVNFGRLLGATPYFVDPLEYDNLAQGIETLPGLAAVALFSALSKSTGWRDMMRLANSSFALATQPLHYGTDLTRLALNDKAATLRWLDAYLQELTDLRRLLAGGDKEVIDITMENIVAQREKWLIDRSENEWTEGMDTKVERPTLSNQLLGGWLGGKLSKDSRDE